VLGLWAHLRQIIVPISTPALTWSLRRTEPGCHQYKPYLMLPRLGLSHKPTHPLPMPARICNPTPARSEPAISFSFGSSYYRITAFYACHVHFLSLSAVTSKLLFLHLCHLCILVTALPFVFVPDCYTTLHTLINVTLSCKRYCIF